MSTGNPQFTGWYSGDQKPARPGVYQREFPTGCILFCRFDGQQWFRGFLFRGYAEKTKVISEKQSQPWRGLDREVTP